MEFDFKKAFTDEERLELELIVAREHDSGDSGYPFVTVKDLYENILGTPNVYARSDHYHYDDLVPQRVEEMIAVRISDAWRSARVEAHLCLLDASRLPFPKRLQWFAEYFWDSDSQNLDEHYRDRIREEVTSLKRTALRQMPSLVDAMLNQYFVIHGRVLAEMKKQRSENI